MPSLIETVDILSFPISTLSLKGVANQVLRWRKEGRRAYILPCTANDLVWAKRSRKVKQSLQKANLLVADGMSLVWIAHLMKKKKIERIYGPDLLLELCRLTENREISHYFYGSTNGVLKELVRNLKKRFPRLKIAGSCSPPFHFLTGKQAGQFIRKIREKKPDIVWVGLGCPKQNIWAMEALPKLHSCMVITVGAAFDFLAGNKKQAPLWMQGAGLEWLFRLIQEPGRLWKRYLWGIPIFAFLVFQKEILKRRLEERDDH